MHNKFEECWIIIYEKKEQIPKLSSDKFSDEFSQSLQKISSFIVV